MLQLPILVLIATSLFGQALQQTAPAAPPPAQPPGSSADDSIIALETSMWEAEKTGDATRVAKRLAQDFVQVETSGIIDRAAALKQVAGMRLESYSLSNVRVLRPSTDDLAVVVFEFVQQAKGEPESRGYAASTWVNRGRMWLNVLYVGVPKQPAR